MATPCSVSPPSVTVRHDGRWRSRANTLLASLAVLAGVWLWPQRSAAAPRWDPITPEELALKASTIDPQAGAEALFWKVWVTDVVAGEDVASKRDHYVRLKIYTEQAAETWKLVRLPVAGQGVRVGEVDARTVEPDGKVVMLDRRTVSTETVSRVHGKKRIQVSFALPAVRPGCIVEYRYHEEQDDVLADFEEFPLQLSVPARRVVYSVKPLQIPGWDVRRLTFHVLAKTGTKNIEGYHVLEAPDMPAFVEEPDMPSAGQLRAVMLLYYTQAQNTTPAKFWTRTGADRARSFRDWCSPDDGLRQTAASIVAGAPDDDEKLRRLVEWCRREIRLVRSSDPDSLRASHVHDNGNARGMLRQRAGTPFELDMLFGALAGAAGFETRFLHVPRRGDLQFDQEMMDLRFLKSWEIAVHTQNGWRFFDPQDPWLPWDMVPRDEEGEPGLLCDRDSTMFQVIPVAPPEKSVRTSVAELVLEPDGTLSGDVRVRWSGHWNSVAREALDDAADTLETFQDVLDWDDAWIDTHQLRFESGGDPHQPLLARMKVRMAGHGLQAGHRMTLEPSAWWAHRAPEFASSQRTWPVAFDFAGTERDTIRIRLPDGWAVEALESPHPIHAEGVGGYRITTREIEGGRTLECTREFEIGKDGALWFAAENYPELKRLFDMVLDRDRSAVVLNRPEPAR